VAATSFLSWTSPVAVIFEVVSGSISDEYTVVTESQILKSKRELVVVETQKTG
jgi:hypothetical protein